MRGWKTGFFAVDADYPKRGNVSLLLRKTIARGSGGKRGGGRGREEEEREGEE